MTALFTIQQIEEVFEVIDKSTPAILSIFAGRIADTGIDPSEIINHAVKLSKLKPNTKIWKYKRNT